MGRTWKAMTVSAGALVLLGFVVLIVNQTAQLVQLAAAIHPTLGRGLLWTLIVAYGVLVAVPVALFIRLPRPLVPPESEASPEFEAYLTRLGERLAANPNLAGPRPADRRGIEEALGALDRQAEEVVRATAAGVFLATAVSQNGRLDGFLVLAAQTRMIWRVAHLYHQRPAVGDLIRLYANVAGTTFVAGELQDLDLGEQVEPVLAATLGALGGSIPGLQVVASVLADSVLNGSANAFLTLRVGMIARRYCGSLVAPPRATVRRAATAEAAQLLGAIVAEGSGRITKAVWQATKGRVGGAVTGMTEYARETGGKVLAMMGRLRAREQTEIG